MSRYDPNRHHRHSTRLEGYDYAQAGAYFVTICTWKAELFFEDPALADIVQDIWTSLPIRFPLIVRDAFVVMPNHVHFVLWLQPGEGVMNDARTKSPYVPTNIQTSRNGAPLRRPKWDQHAPALGEVIRTFKAMATRRIHQQCPGTTFAWHRNYYEHIIRSESALQAIRQYITDNPERWHLDRYNAAAIERDPDALALWELLKRE